MPYIKRKYRNASPILRLAFGKQILDPTLMRLVRRITLVHRRGKADDLTIEFSNDDMTLGDRKIFLYGTPIYVVGGWDDEIVEKGPFMLYDHEYLFPEDRDATLAIKAKDKSIGAMHEQKKNVRHTGKQLTRLVAAIAKEYKLEYDIDVATEDDIIFDDDYSLTQAGESDARLLQRVAEKIGYSWGVKDNTLYFKRPEVIGTSILVLNYSMGDKSLKYFKPEVKARGPAKKKKVAKEALICHDFLDPEQTKSYRVGQILAGKVQGTSADWAEINSQLKRTKQASGSKDFATPPLSSLLENPSIDGAIAMLETVVTDTNEFVSSSDDDRLASSGGIPTTNGSNRADRFSNPDDPKNQVTALINGIDKSTRYRYPTEAEEVEVLESIDYSQADAGGAVPVQEAAIKRQLAKSERVHHVAVSATMKPTVPSWTWNIDMDVKVNGVGELCSGIYELTQVTLNYTRESGLDTELVGRKRSVGAPAKKQKGNSSTNYLDEEGGQSIDPAYLPQYSYDSTDSSVETKERGQEPNISTITLINGIDKTSRDVQRLIKGIVIE